MHDESINNTFEVIEEYHIRRTLKYNIGLFAG
jgi:hypothetical protein